MIQASLRDARFNTRPCAGLERPALKSGAATRRNVLKLMNGEFKYEVAFSFLQDDEQLASQIADRIRDRVSVALFIYSERQNELAGTDGVERFSCIFGEES